MGTYCSFEEDAPLPNLMKDQRSLDGLWSLFFDGSRNKNGSGAGVMLISPNLEKCYFSYRLQFSFTKNVVEYKGLIQGIQLAQKRGIKSLRVFRNSELVIN